MINMLGTLFGGATGNPSPWATPGIIRQPTGGSEPALGNAELGAIMKMMQQAQRQNAQADTFMAIANRAPNNWGDVIGTLMGTYMGSKRRGEADETIASAIEKQMAYEAQQKRLQAEAEAKKPPSNAFELFMRDPEGFQRYQSMQRGPQAPSDYERFQQDPEGYAKFKAAGRGPNTVIHNSVGTGEDAARRADRALNETVSYENSSGLVNDLIERSSATTTGLIGALTGAIPGSKSLAFRSDLDTVKSRLGFEQLQQIRDWSKTGGALGSVSNLEIGKLESTIASLDPRMSEADIDRNLRKVDEHYSTLIEIDKLLRRVEAGEITEQEAEMLARQSGIIGGSQRPQEGPSDAELYDMYIR